MRIEILHEPGKGFSLRLAHESEPELEQLRELKSLGIEKKIGRVEFGVPRRRSSVDAAAAPANDGALSFDVVE